MTQLTPLFLEILAQHRGLARAISVADMAEQLGLGRDKTGQRKAQEIKRAAVDGGSLVGSSCAHLRGGWYHPETDEEIRRTCAQYEARIRSLAALVRHTRGAAGFKAFVGELALEFQEQTI